MNDQASNMHAAHNSDWETVIGLEVHVQLATASKIFSGAPTCYGAEPNTQACAIDLALPGTLPVLNREAVNMAIKFGLSIDAKINQRNVFERKNYFYPDLPKGYQISQNALPIVGTGKLDISPHLKTATCNSNQQSDKKIIAITRAHLEEDAGKSIHEGLQGVTGIDLNRAGTPLLEVVSEPELRSAAEAVAYLKTLHSLVCYLGICDGNMQEGSFRCDANVSIRPRGNSQLGTRTEIKNVNSFRFVERAIEYEVQRQIDLLEDGGQVTQETRLYDPARDQTRSMRSKEEAHDYRYFPDPDLLPVEIDQHYIEQIQAQLPELPWERKTRLQTEYNLSAYDANFITQQRELADYFEACCQAQPEIPAKAIANWLSSDMAAALNRHHLSITQAPILPDRLAKLALRVHDMSISLSVAKKVFQDMWEENLDPDEIIKAKGLQQMNDDTELKQIIAQVIAANPQQLADYRAGKEKLLSYFVGQVMKASRGRANPNQVNQILKQQLAG